MKRMAPLAVCLGLAATLISADLAEASVRKCTITRNGLQVDVSAAIVVLNGQILGTLGIEGRDPRPGDVFMSDIVPTPDDVVSVNIICIEVSEGDRMVGRQAVAVVTKQGAVEFMRSHLRALSALQEEHRTVNGAYAESLLELGYFDSRAPLPIELAADRDGWTAKIELEGVNTSCQVHGGSPADIPGDQPANLVQCAAT